MSLSIKGSINPNELTVDEFGNIGVVLKTSTGGNAVFNAVIADTVNVNANQTGVWSVGRTWELDSVNDSVSIVQSGDLLVKQDGVWSVGRTWELDSVNDSVSIVQSSDLLVKQDGVWSVGRTWNLSALNDTVNVVQSGSFVVNQGLAGAQAWNTNATQSGNWSVTANAGTGIFNVQGEVISEPGEGVFKTRIEEGKGTNQLDPLFTKNNKQFKTIHAFANSGQAITITIPPVPGKLTYISKIQIDVYFNATFANIALSLGTITNLSPSSMNFFVPNAGNIGTTQSVVFEFPEPVLVNNSAADFVLSVPAIANKLYAALVSYMND